MNKHLTEAYYCAEGETDIGHLHVVSFSSGNRTMQRPVICNCQACWMSFSVCSVVYI